MSKEKDAAGKALEQAAKLRKEIADLEQDLAKGKLTANVAGDDTAGSVENSADKLTEPSSSEYGNGFSLAPTKWLIMMDIGREKGTWMPQSWGISGRRVEVDITVQFLPGGEMVAVLDSPFIDMAVRPGRWNVGPSEGSNLRRRKPAASGLNVISDTCRFWVETDGFARGDVTIPAGKLFFAVPAWGGQLSRKGLVTVRQKRWIVREESRILGVCATERIDVDADGVAQPRAPRTRKPPFASGFKD